MRGAGARVSIDIEVSFGVFSDKNGMSGINLWRISDYHDKNSNGKGCRAIRRFK